MDVDDARDDGDDGEDDFDEAEDAREDAVDASEGSSEDEDDDEEEDDDDVELDDAQLDTIMTLEQELESDSWRDYAKAGRLIDLLRAANMRERCRTARGTGTTRCSRLDEARWSAWIQDELANKDDRGRNANGTRDAMRCSGGRSKSVDGRACGCTWEGRGTRWSWRVDEERSTRALRDGHRGTGDELYRWAFDLAGGIERLNCRGRRRKRRKRE